jgi:hypothetical protein
MPYSVNLFHCHRESFNITPYFIHSIFLSAKLLIWSFVSWDRIVKIFCNCIFNIWCNLTSNILDLKFYFKFDKFFQGSYYNNNAECHLELKYKLIYISWNCSFVLKWHFASQVFESFSSICCRPIPLQIAIC